jgi:hypothetical protein
MDDRLIFLYFIMCVINVVRTEKDMRATYRMVVQGRRRLGEVNPSEDYAESQCGEIVRFRKT